MSFNAIRKNIILAKISEFTVLYSLTLCMLGNFLDNFLSSADFFFSKLFYPIKFFHEHHKCQTVWVRSEMSVG